MAATVVESLEKVPEAWRPEYEQAEDGKFYLKLEGEPRGFVPVEKLDEFRSNNRKLNSQLEQTAAKLKEFDGVDLEQYREYTELQRKVKDKELIEAGKIDELIASKIEPVKKDFHTRLEIVTKEKQQLASQLEGITIDAKLIEIGAKHGLRPSATDDLVARGRRVFRLKDGKPAALAEDGTPVYDKEGNPVTMERWIESLATEAPHLFQPSSGTGATGNNGHRPATTGKQLQRSEFDKLPPMEQRSFIVDNKGVVVD